MGRGKSQRSLDLIASVYTILEAIQPASIRAVGYQLFTRGVIAWDRADVAERAERESLSSILNAWPGISRQASKYEGRA